MSIPRTKPNPTFKDTARIKMYIYKLLVRIFYNKMQLFIIQSNVSNIPVGSIKIGGFSSWSFNISVLLRFGSVLELSLLSRPIAAPGVRPFVPKSSDEIESWLLCEARCISERSCWRESELFTRYLMLPKPTKLMFVIFGILDALMFTFNT